MVQFPDKEHIVAKEVVSVEDFEKKSLWDEFSSDKKTVTVIDTESGRTKAGHGRTTKDATDDAIRRLDNGW